MAGLGLALGGVQLLPLYELVSQSFREGSADLRQVLDWAWPARQLVTFVLPDAFGNPTHHAYFDIWQRAWVPVTQNALGDPMSVIDWGKKNYVEAGNYLGITTLLLAALALISLVTARRAGAATQPERPAAGEEPVSPQRAPSRRFYIALFGVLALLSLLFAFGTPLYAVLFYLVPGYGQLHSAFRWVFPYTLSMALLAGFGLDLILRFRSDPAVRRPARLLALLAAAGGAVALLVVALSAVLPAPFVALGQRLLESSDLAQVRGFADGRMAWSYEAAGIARFGIVALLSGAALSWLLRIPRPGGARGRLAAAVPALARSSRSCSGICTPWAAASTRRPIAVCSSTRRRWWHGSVTGWTAASRGASPRWTGRARSC